MNDSPRYSEKIGDLSREKFKTEVRFSNLGDALRSSGIFIALIRPMPSLPRGSILTDRSTFHITWQCHNRSWLLESDWAKSFYYKMLLKFKDRYQVKIYSYCFMSNHPHLTGYCESKKLLSDLFRVVNSLFARAYNQRAKRRGQVVMDRFNMVKHPKEYRWTSFHFYAYGKQDPLSSQAGPAKAT